MKRTLSIILAIGLLSVFAIANSETMMTSQGKWLLTGKMGKQASIFFSARR